MKAHDNPFRASRIEALRFRLATVRWDDLLARIDAMKRRGAIVGPHGFGKTTLLEELSRRFESQGDRVLWIRSRRGEDGRTRVESQLPQGSLGARSIVLVDGADLLSLPRWYALRWRTRKAGGLIVSTHVEGWLPTIYRCQTSPALLRSLYDELVGDQVDWTFEPPNFSALHQRHAGNARDAFRELYDRFAATIRR